jgi:hypothetical protein
LVLILIAAFLIAVLLPAIDHSRDAANRIKCADNLRQIGMGLTLYATDNLGQFPRTRYAPARRVIPDISSAGADSINPFSLDSQVPANCVPSALFLILRTQQMASSVFVCPSTGGRPDDFGGGHHTAIDRGNFTSAVANLSYSYANPYPDWAAQAKGFRLSEDLNAGFAIMADMNPGLYGGSDLYSINTASSTVQMRRANSRNHFRDGQNVLYADGNVEFDSNPLVGVRRDNIYCRGMGGPAATAADVVNSPKDTNDSVLLPAEGE